MEVPNGGSVCRRPGTRRLARRRFDSRRGAERQRAQRLIGLIDELLPAEVDKQSNLFRSWQAIQAGGPWRQDTSCNVAGSLVPHRRLNFPLCALCLSAPLREVGPPPEASLSLPPTPSHHRHHRLAVVPACRSVVSRVVVFDSRRGAERQRAQRSIGLIDELLPAEVDRQSKREVHGDNIRLEMSPALSFSIVVSISLSALSASPRLCVRFPS